MEQENEDLAGTESTSLESCQSSEEEAMKLINDMIRAYTAKFPKNKVLTLYQEVGLWGRIVRELLKMQLVVTDEDKKELKVKYDQIMRARQPTVVSVKHAPRKPKTPEPENMEQETEQITGEPKPQKEEEEDDEADEDEGKGEGEDAVEGYAEQEMEALGDATQLIQAADVLKGELDNQAKELNKELSNVLYIDDQMARLCNQYLRMIDSAHHSFIKSNEYYGQSKKHLSTVMSSQWTSLWAQIHKTETEINNLQKEVPHDALYEFYLEYSKYLEIFFKNILLVVGADKEVE